MKTSLARLPAKAMAMAAVTSGLAISAPAPPPSPVPVRFGADTQLSVATSGLHDFVEPAIAASPLDPGNLVAAFFGVKDLYTSTCFFRSSRDGGATWAPGGTIATRFPDDLSDDATRTDQFFPWIAAHPSGLISLVWLDKRLDPDNVNFDLFYTNTGGGQPGRVRRCDRSGAE